MSSTQSSFAGNEAHLEAILRVEGDQSDFWDTWRAENPGRVDLRGVDLRGASLGRLELSNANLLQADLRGAKLAGAKLSGANLVYAGLSGADLDGADLIGANLEEAQLPEASLVEALLRHADITAANFRGANLTKANLERTYAEDTIFTSAVMPYARLSEANLWGANLEEANLSCAVLRDANLNQVNLRGANLNRADLIRARLTGARLEGATLRGAEIYGISVWDVSIDKMTDQRGLSIAPPGAAESGRAGLTVDDLELAQFVNLLVDHRKLRGLINAVSERGVLILGRFKDGGLEVLRRIADRLREDQYLPIIFEFDRPKDRNRTETVRTLAGLSRFVIADLSGPSVAQELGAIVPDFKIPVVPIIEVGRRPWGMVADILEYPWLVELIEFDSVEHLLALIPSRIIGPAEEKQRERQALLDRLFSRQ